MDRPRNETLKVLYTKPMDSIYLLSYMQNKLERMSWKSIETGSLVIMIAMHQLSPLFLFRARLRK